MPWEELDAGLGWGAASGVTMTVGPRKKMGRVKAGTTREDLGTKDVIEFTLGREVIDKLSLKIKETSEDQWIEEKFRIQWGTGPQLGFLRIAIMSDQGLSGLELRCLRKGTIFKIRSDKLPSYYSKLAREGEPLDFDVDPSGKFIEVGLPDDFYDLTAPPPEKKVNLAPPLAIPAPQTVLIDPATQKYPMSIPEFEQDAIKRIKGFSIDISGRYFITLSGQADKYTIDVILKKLNENRQKSGLGPVVLR